MCRLVRQRVDSGGGMDGVACRCGARADARMRANRLSRHTVYNFLKSHTYDRSETESHTRASTSRRSRTSNGRHSRSGVSRALRSRVFSILRIWRTCVARRDAGRRARTPPRASERGPTADASFRRVICNKSLWLCCERVLGSLVAHLRRVDLRARWPLDGPLDAARRLRVRMCEV